MLAAACIGSSLPSSGSFLEPSELFEIQIEWVVYLVMCGYVACVLSWGVQQTEPLQSGTQAT
jgi:hypothetical protein